MLTVRLWCSQCNCDAHSMTVIQYNCDTLKKTHPPWLFTVKVFTTNADRSQQRWTRQLLRGSTPLPCPATLKLISLPLVSRASFRLKFYAQWRLVLCTRRPLPHSSPPSHSSPSLLLLPPLFFQNYKPWNKIEAASLNFDDIRLLIVCSAISLLISHSRWERY